MKRLRQLQGAAGHLQPRQYKRALNAALYQGLREERERQPLLAIARDASKQTEKNRANRERKRDKKRQKQSVKQEDRDQEKRFKGQVEQIPFGQRLEAPPAEQELQVFTQKLDRMKEKMERKKMQQQQQTMVRRTE